MNNIVINKITSMKLYDGDTLIAVYKEPPCELFTICNCKTAMCRTVLPDESCYYYRYFKKLIEENKNECGCCCSK